MFGGLEWHWWLIVAAAALSIPLKVRFMKWWSKRQEEQSGGPRDKWGDAS